MRCFDIVDVSDYGLLLIFDANEGEMRTDWMMMKKTEKKLTELNSRIRTRITFMHRNDDENQFIVNTMHF